MRAIAIVGPTASGKTAVALELARRLDTEVVSFDSRQVYRGVEVSSNAPTAAEMRGIPVHLTSVLDPRREVTAASYVEMAHEAVAAFPRGRVPVLTAGTGLYLKAYLDGLDLGGMGAVPGLRQQLEAEAQADLPGLARRLSELSPELAARTDLSNPVRVVRRMEILWAAALAEDGAAETGSAARVDATTVGLRVSPGQLEDAITVRVERMLDAGWQAEVEKLLALEPPPAAQVLKSIGVAEMAAYLRGGLDLDGLRWAVRLRTRQYAKRQRTWFRGDPGVRWVEAGNRRPSDIVEEILESLN